MESGSEDEAEAEEVEVEPEEEAGPAGGSPGKRLWREAEEDVETVLGKRPRCVARLDCVWRGVAQCPLTPQP